MNASDNSGNGVSEEQDDTFFDYGEWVEFRLNESVFGIVIGADIHGLIYTVQLAGTGAVQSFHGVTLRAMEPEDDEPTGDKESNVIDFTQAVDLRNAKTKGAA